MIPSLDKLALKYGTGKSSREHGYTELYQVQLAHVREAAITLLEIGIADGASHKMWHDWMPNAMIHGLDISKSAPCSGYDRLRYHHGDQESAADIGKLVASAGPMDVIIDDGGHVASAVISCLEMLFLNLRPGGIYVIEDLHVGSDDRNRIQSGRAPMKMGSSRVTALEYLAALQNPHPTFGSIEIFKDNIAFIKKPR